VEVQWKEMGRNEKNLRNADVLRENVRTHYTCLLPLFEYAALIDLMCVLISRWFDLARRVRYFAAG
jgi:hypothetical protein